MQTADAIDYFLSAKEAEGRSRQTLDQYANRLIRFSKWAGDPDISTISVAMVRSYIAYLQASGVRQVTVASMIRPLKVFCRFLAAEEMLERDPFQRVKVPTFEKQLHDLLTDEDFKKLLSGCDLQTHEGRRNYAILCFLYDTGVRVGELSNLRTADIDVKGRWAKVLGKGSKERVVFFSAGTAMAMTRYTARMPARYRHPEWFFTSMRRNVGGRLSGDGVFQMLQRLGRRTGVKSRVNPHTFRHTFATNYLRAGGDLNSLMRLMGHADLTILQTYLSLVTDDLQAKHEQFSPMARLMSRR